MKNRKNPPEFVIKDGKPTAVILNIKDYEEMLMRLEDAEDLKVLRETRKNSLKFKRLEDFLDEYQPDA